jgi:hypothetical protein
MLCKRSAIDASQRAQDLQCEAFIALAQTLAEIQTDNGKGKA